MDREVRELRSRLSEVERRGRRQRRDYPPRLRAQLQAYVRKQRECGESLYRIGEDLGLPVSTVTMWSKQRPAAAEFRPVVVAPSRLAGPVESEREASTAILVTPSGYRVEGLHLSELVVLLQALA